jgi:hypothetical protein
VGPKCLKEKMKIVLPVRDSIFLATGCGNGLLQVDDICEKQSSLKKRERKGKTLGDGA